MDLKKKLTNIWYYYKMYILIGIVLLLALAIGINSCVNRRKYDLNLLFVTHGYSDSFFQSDELADLFDKYVSDVNGDGMANTQLITINYGITAQSDNTAAATRAANLASGKAVLFLLDEQNYTELKSAGFLQELSGYGGSDYLDGDRFKIYESGMLDGVSGFAQLDDNYYLCMRTYDETKAQNDAFYRMQNLAAQKTLENILNEY